jgi:hypothetical protein
VSYVDENGVSHTIPGELHVDDVEEDRTDWYFKTPFIDSRINVKVAYKGKGESVGKIDSWFYDAELKLFVIKRIDGCQYFQIRFEMFKALPLIEVTALAQMKLYFRPINLNQFGRNVSETVDWKIPFYLKYMRHEVAENKFEKCQVQKGKWVKVRKAGVVEAT